jgi:orotidine-5'-phosphate decarboxylase
LSAKDKLIVALDVPTIAEANTLVEELKDVVGMFKVGSQLFTSVGPSLVESIIEKGNRVFLDLKFHDIPHQVAGAARAAAELGVSLFTVHASGGAEMMERAVEAVMEVAEKNATTRTRIVAVSVLTSMDATSLEQIGVKDSPGEAVKRLVKLAADSGVDGAVCSPQEASVIREAAGPNFLIVTPGIRSAANVAGDQKRVATAAIAISSGASYLVVGRPITEATDRIAAARGIIEEIETAL